MDKAAIWEKELQLKPHPEGGSYIQTYTCPVKHSGRAAGTSIYFLLKEGEHANFHRIDADEMWYHLDGQTLIIHMIDENGNYKQILLGTDPAREERPWVLVPAGTIFATEPEGAFTLSACVVTPGFLFERFELLQRELLLEQFPQHTEVIERFTEELNLF